MCFWNWNCSARKILFEVLAVALDGEFGNELDGTKKFHLQYLDEGGFF